MEPGHAFVTGEMKQHETQTPASRVLPDLAPDRQCHLLRPLLT